MKFLVVQDSAFVQSGDDTSETQEIVVFDGVQQVDYMYSSVGGPFLAMCRRQVCKIVHTCLALDLSFSSCQVIFFAELKCPRGLETSSQSSGSEFMVFVQRTVDFLMSIGHNYQM
jgi:hypothetical protein